MHSRRRVEPGGGIYRVLLHNDDHNLKKHVVDVLLSAGIARDAADAAGIMQEAHERGRATAATCVKEVAEAHVDALRAGGLTGSMEPV